MPFEPKFTHTARIASDLIRIEGVKLAVVRLPIMVSVLTSHPIE